MPPRYAYWTILAGGLPTAFRAAERDDLMPTFQRLREKHPDAEMKWFARGRLWDSPEQARQEGERHRDRPPRSESRPADWRPGGTHRDPRQKFKDAKKARNIERRHARFERKHTGPPAGKHAGPPASRHAGPPASRHSPPAGRPHGDKVLGPPRQPKPAPHPRTESRPRAESRPRTEARPRTESRPRTDSQNTPSGQQRDWRAREQRPDQRNREPRRDWRDRERAPREKPHGDPLARPPRRDNRAPNTRENRSQQDRPAPQTNRSDTRPPAGRPFRPRPRFERNQQPDEAATPPRPSGPTREPRPGERSEPTPPPRPSEPTVLPPGPPERGRGPDDKHRRDRGRR